MTSFPRASGSFLMPHPLLSSHRKGTCDAVPEASCAFSSSSFVLIGKESLMDAVSFLPS